MIAYLIIPLAILLPAVPGWFLSCRRDNVKPFSWQAFKD